MIFDAKGRRIPLDENTIYVRRSIERARWETFVKARGEGAITSVEGGRDENIEAANLVLWAINRYGPEDFKSHFPLDEIPDRPRQILYPVRDEL